MAEFLYICFEIDNDSEEQVIYVIVITSSIHKYIFKLASIMSSPSYLLW